jgi:hypothetical protein
MGEEVKAEAGRVETTEEMFKRKAAQKSRIEAKLREGKK